MDYKAIYYKIIEKAKKETENGNRYVGYYEKHHIIPKSLGGTNDKENIAKLTAREHFICHWLLVKMYDKGTVERNKMLCALWRMQSGNENHKRYINSRVYEKLRIEFAKCVSELTSKTQAGIKNSQYGTHWFSNLKTGETQKFLTAPSDDWIEGRNKVKLYFNLITHEEKLFPGKPNKDWIIAENKDNFLYYKEHGLLDSFNNFHPNKTSIEKLNEEKRMILESGIDVTKYGWVSKAVKILGFTKEHIRFIVLKCPDLKEKVFYRTAKK